LKVVGGALAAADGHPVGPPSHFPSTSGQLFLAYSHMTCYTTCTIVLVEK
jgi:hypothetical protein